MIPRESKGVKIGKVHKFSCHHCDSVEIFYDDVEVPKENLIGTRGNAYAEIMTVLNPERIAVAMMGVGINAAIYELCFKYVQERNAFGGPISRFQILQNYLADMYINLENGRNLTYKAAWLCDQWQALSSGSHHGKTWWQRKAQGTRQPMVRRFLAATGSAMSIRFRCLPEMPTRSSFHLSPMR